MLHTMLWYKAWRETRTRFTLIAFVLVAFCMYAIFFFHRPALHGLPLIPGPHDATYSQHIYDVMYSGTAKGAFAMLVMFLGLGGLLRERANRTVFFTLALPVSRLHLLLAHIAVLLTEVAGLSLLPALLIPCLSPTVNQAYPAVQALHFSALWFTGGAVIIALAFLLSVLLGGDYTAPAVCYALLMIQSIIATWRPLRPYRTNLFWTMGEFGTMRWDATHKLMVSGSLPWTRLLLLGLIALVMFTFAIRTTQRQSF